MDPFDPPDAAQARRIDSACRRFEGEWRAEGSPRIESYLEEVVDGDRAALVFELIALELEIGVDRPGAAEYLARFPDFEAVIGSAFRGPGEGFQDPVDVPGSRSRHDRSSGFSPDGSDHRPAGVGRGNPDDRRSSGSR